MRLGSLSKPGRRPLLLGGAIVLVASTAMASTLESTAITPSAASSTPAQRPGFAKPRYVDNELAGGEPFVIHSSRTGRLVYSAHEGSTHLYRDGLVSGEGDGDFASNYRNQVNVWWSDDHGINWRRASWKDTGFVTNPTVTGFSDPDLTEDAGGTIYDTGIDLANDALFSSANGGKAWNTGTPFCHEGDRPWLAGGRPGEVFMATDTETTGHQVFRSTDHGGSCSSQGITDEGKVAGHDYAGDGKLYYDRHDGSLVEPIKMTRSGRHTGLGVSVLPHASTAFDRATPPKFRPRLAVRRTTMKGHWPAIAIDRGDNTYLVWDTDPRQAGTKGGCNGMETPRANSIKMVHSSDHGRTWSRPMTVAHPGGTVLWPWITAGNDGNVSVTWYQYDRVVDPDCATTGAVRVFAANIFGAAGQHPQVRTVNASGRPVHRGGICQGGTTCVATGQDRRLGDYLSNAIDGRGCVLIATADTMMRDPATGGPLPTARPLFISQDSGRSLTGRNCAHTPR